MGHLLNLNTHIQVSQVRNLASTSVPLRPITVQFAKFSTNLDETDYSVSFVLALPLHYLWTTDKNICSIPAHSYVQLSATSCEKNIQNIFKSLKTWQN